jgi:hypothetical protein
MRAPRDGSVCDWRGWLRVDGVDGRTVAATEVKKTEEKGLRREAGLNKPSPGVFAVPRLCVALGGLPCPDFKFQVGYDWPSFR